MKKKNFKWLTALSITAVALPLVAASCDNIFGSIFGNKDKTSDFEKEKYPTIFYIYLLTTLPTRNQCIWDLMEI
ncbi:hypothetical protein DA803_02890 [[Mycoplasma] phocae]|uniref:Variable surface lipoprotein n=1 Tax=[Mycoplasma] phocae TaxID=142651 RepID=A0A2Z5IQI2_9BACT|nr:variable surface lipoprotein [[Mycoplasma] phocae]AXE61015.1 hypothetical protein DA803_02890 [[Mycoplasma] phocae]